MFLVQPSLGVEPGYLSGVYGDLGWGLERIGCRPYIVALSGGCSERKG